MNKTLSDKIKHEKERAVAINTEAWCVARRIEVDVKEAVKRLKEKNTITHQITMDDIKEIFGEKLI